MIAKTYAIRTDIEKGPGPLDLKQGDRRIRVTTNAARTYAAEEDDRIGNMGKSLRRIMESLGGRGDSEERRKLYVQANANARHLVDLLARALRRKERLSYGEAIKRVLDEDEDLKKAYLGI